MLSGQSTGAASLTISGAGNKHRALCEGAAQPPKRIRSGPHARGARGVHREDWLGRRRSASLAIGLLSGGAVQLGVLGYLGLRRQPARKLRHAARSAGALALAAASAAQSRCSSGCWCHAGGRE